MHSNVRRRTVAIYTSVSYTHLDVYKRQLWRTTKLRCVLALRAIQPEEICMWGNSGWLKRIVGYTVLAYSMAYIP